MLVNAIKGVVKTWKEKNRQNSFWNAKLPIEERLDWLLANMTLEEKIGQMNQISSYGNIEDMSGLIKKGEVGSILNEVDPVRVNALQRVAMEESRLGIPLLMARDVIHGFKTIFPIPLGQAASFNPQVAKDGARVAAVEASCRGYPLDICTDDRCGSRSPLGAYGRRMWRRYLFDFSDGCCYGRRFPGRFAEQSDFHSRMS